MVIELASILEMDTNEMDEGEILNYNLAMALHDAAVYRTSIELREQDWMEILYPDDDEMESLRYSPIPDDDEDDDPMPFVVLAPAGTSK